MPKRNRPSIGDMDNFMVAETWLHEVTIEGQFVRKMPKVLFLLVGGLLLGSFHTKSTKKSGPPSICTKFGTKNLVTCL